MDVLIDLDGTLTDPKVGIVSSVQYALGALNCAIPAAETLNWVIGPPLRDTFPKLGVNAGDVEQALVLYRLNYTGHGQVPADGAALSPVLAPKSKLGLNLGATGGPTPAMFSATVYPEIPAVLSRLKADGHRLIVCTSKPHVYARPILEHFELADYFAAIHGAELDGRRDDKSDLIAHIIETERVDASKAVMIGDRLFDINGARANAMRSIGVLWGYGSAEELSAAGADALCEQPSALVDLIS
jgi:phosphoglycolate phosphatase